MNPLILIGAGLGIAQGIGANEQRKQEAEDQKKLIDMQQASNRRRLQSTSSILTGNLTIGAMQATQSSKAAAIEAFKADSQGQAAVGASGLSGGSGFYALDRQVADNRNALIDQNKMLQTQINTQELSGGAQIAGIQDQIAITGEQQSQMQEQLDYLSSPMAFILSAASGALSGASMGQSVTQMGVSLTGNANFGQVDLGDLFKKPEILPYSPAGSAMDAAFRSDYSPAGPTGKLFPSSYMPFGPEYIGPSLYAIQPNKGYSPGKWSGSVGGAGGENLFTMYNTGKTGKPLRFSGSEGVLQ
jgi:hypothetical protein